MRRALLLLAALPGLTLSACTSDAVFTCSTSGQCVHAGISGTCESSGYCSFADLSCSSGRRYGDYAPAGVADLCVGTTGGMPDAGGMSIDARPQTQVKLDPIADTYVSSSQMNANFGSSSEIRSDGDSGKVALMRWDLASIPPGSTVVSATLSVTTSSSGGLTQGSTQIFAITEDWTEGNNSGSTGTANWTMRTSAAAWSSAGVGASSHAATAMAQFIPSSSSTRYDVALPAAPVQAWLNSPGSNFGVVFIDSASGTASLGISSRESTPSSRRPSLTVSYYPP